MASDHAADLIPSEGGHPPAKVDTPCKPLTPSRRRSLDADSAPSFSVFPHIISSPDLAPIMQDHGVVLALLEKHLDPMVHEAEIDSMYSPDTTLPRPVSPVFVPSARQVTQATPRRGDLPVDVFLAEMTTPSQQPLLPVPGNKQRRPCRNKVIISSQRQSVRLANKAIRNSKLHFIAQEIWCSS